MGFKPAGDIVQEEDTGIGGRGGREGGFQGVMGEMECVG